MGTRGPREPGAFIPPTAANVNAAAAENTDSICILVLSRKETGDSVLELGPVTLPPRTHSLVADVNFKLPLGRALVYKG
jgi:hypothetical protein